jgi:chromosome partitioning protein
VVSSGNALERFNVTNPSQAGAQQFVLRDFLEEVRSDFDVALIDTGPNTCGLLAWASLVASDFVLSPVLCDAFGTQSIISVQRLTEHVQTTVNPRLQIAGYFINMRQKNAVMDAYEQTLRRVHGPQMLTTVLPLAAAYRQAVVERTPLLMKKGRSKPVKTIIAFAEEVATRMLELTEQSRRVA